jgi:uncharacterized protein YdaU (DUF1376 family)
LEVLIVMDTETDFDGSRRPYMRLWINDIKGSTADWSCAQFGAHMRLLMAAWERGHVPSNEKALRRICRDMDWDEMPEVLERWRKVTIDGVGEVYINARLERERERMMKDRSAKAENGRKGGLAKAKQTSSKEDGKDLANDVANDLALPYSHTPILPDSQSPDDQTPIHSSDTCVARSKRRAKPADPLSWNPDEEWVGITDADRADWAEAFPAVDIDAKLKGLTLWLRATPKKAKKSRWRAWLLGRLREEQDRGGSASKPQVSRNQAADKPQTREQYRPFNAPEDCDPSEYHRFRTPDGRPCSPSIYLTKGGRKRFITGEWYDDVIGKPPALPPAQTADEIALFGKISPRRDRQTDVA